MSYILDALKKSEQQRGHETIPNVQTVHSSSLNYHDEKRTYWPHLLIAAVILNLIAIVYFIIDKDSISENNTTTVQHAAIDDNIEKTTAENIPQSAAPEIRKKLIRKPTSTNTKIVPEKTEPVFHTTAAAIKTKTNSTINSEIRTARATSIPVVNKRPVSAQKEIIDFYDLPASIQQQLPAIIVSAHVYSSNPLQRSMVINNNFKEEGEYVIDNLVLHEITADGAIFDYEEFRFHYGVVSGWQ